MPTILTLWVTCMDWLGCPLSETCQMWQLLLPMFLCTVLTCMAGWDQYLKESKLFVCLRNIIYLYVCHLFHCIHRHAFRLPTVAAFQFNLICFACSNQSCRSSKFCALIYCTLATLIRHRIEINYTYVFITIGSYCSRITIQLLL